MIQFEDFSSDHARILLDRYRFSGITTFNDDIQGTQAAATAGLLGALRVKGQDASAIVQERIVVCGCGSAGLGVSNMLVKMLVRHGLSVEEAKSRLYMFDMEGLVTTARGDSVDGTILELARSEEATVRDKDDLLTVVKAAKPSVLIGLTGTGGLFTEEVIQAMNECNDRPIFMPMSNPTSRLECTHEDVRRICGQRAIYMSGSPQQDVVVDSKVMCASQANNIYIFPGLALGAFLSEGGRCHGQHGHRCDRESARDVGTRGFRHGTLLPEVGSHSGRILSRCMCRYKAGACRRQRGQPAPHASHSPLCPSRRRHGNHRVYPEPHVVA